MGTLSALVLAGALGAGCLLGGCSSGSGETASTAAASSAVAESSAADSSAAVATAASGDLQERLKAANELAGKTMTKEEVEAILGPSVRFEMSSEGCERGVYAGIFYYDDFTVF